MDTNFAQPGATYVVISAGTLFAHYLIFILILLVAIGATAWYVRKLCDRQSGVEFAERGVATAADLMARQNNLLLKYADMLDVVKSHGNETLSSATDAMVRAVYAARCDGPGPNAFQPRPAEGDDERDPRHIPEPGIDSTDLV